MLVVCADVVVGVGKPDVQKLGAVSVADHAKSISSCYQSAGDVGPMTAAILSVRLCGAAGQQVVMCRDLTLQFEVTTIDTAIDDRDSLAEAAKASLVRYMPVR